MGRRSLRKIDASLDLCAHLLSFDALPQPCTAAALFGREAPLEVEVGSGKGLFLVSQAAARPDTCFLGIEIAQRYARFAAARLVRAGLTGAKLVAADAQRVFAERLADVSLAAVHVYFPDPWWKARHKKRRVLNAAFLRHVERTLQPGGSLHFWTDVEEYFQSTLALIAAETRLAGPCPVPVRSPEDDVDYRTHFERRMRLHERPIYRAEFRREEK